MARTSIRGEAGRFHTLAVTIETGELIKKLAENNDMPVYRYVGDLIEREAMRQGTNRNDPASGKSDKRSLASTITRLFGSERGRDVLMKMELAKWDDQARDDACTLLLKGEKFGFADKVLVHLQFQLNQELKASSHVPLPILSLENSPV